MKKILTLFAGLAIVASAISCGDEKHPDDGPQSAAFKFSVQGLDALSLSVIVTPDNDGASWVWCGLAPAELISSEAALNEYAQSALASTTTESLNYGARNIEIGYDYESATEYYAVAAVVNPSSKSLVDVAASARFTSPEAPSLSFTEQSLSSTAAEYEVNSNSAGIAKAYWQLAKASEETVSAETLISSGKALEKFPTSLSFGELAPQTAYKISYVLTDANGTTLTEVVFFDFTTLSQAAGPVENATAAYYGKANCIILAPGGTATFDAAPYYTTSDVFAYENVDGKEVMHKFASAALLWSDVNKNHVKVSYDTEAQTVTVSNANELEGNSVIALYDADGQTILWSFHIWVEGSNAVDINQLSRDGTIYKVLDRNLGATTNYRYDTDDNFDKDAALGSYGLYYQWGRKDPFVGPITYNEGQFHDVYPLSGEAKQIARTEATGLISYTIAHPNHFICGDESNYDWLCEHNDKLWGNAGYVDGETKVESSLGTESSKRFNTPLNKNKGVKSVYDPCPEGYHVAPMDAWGYFTKSGTFETTSTIRVTNVMDHNAGWEFYYGADSEHSNYYPFAGYIAYYGQPYGIANFGYVWSNSPTKEQFLPVETARRDEYAIYFYFDQGKVYPISNNYKSLGCPVRCCRL